MPRSGGLLAGTRPPVIPRIKGRGTRPPRVSQLIEGSALTEFTKVASLF